MATLGELQQQLADLKERYSEVIEGSYSYESDIATIAVNMQKQLDDAQIAASSAGVYAAAAESAADEATVAGAAAGAEAGASEAQTKYDSIFEQAHNWSKTQTFYSLNARDASADDLRVEKGDIYTLKANTAEVTGTVNADAVSASTFSAYTLKLAIAGATPVAQFDTSMNRDGIDVNIAGYNYYSDGVSERINTTLHIQSIDAYSYVKTAELVIGPGERSVLVNVTATNDNLTKFELADDSYSLVLACYSADLQFCRIGDSLIIGDVELSAGELMQLKALINQ